MLTKFCTSITNNVNLRTHNLLTNHWFFTILGNKKNMLHFSVCGWSPNLIRKKFFVANVNLDSFSNDHRLSTKTKNTLTFEYDFTENEWCVLFGQGL